MREVSLWVVYGNHVWHGVVVLAAALGIAASWLLIDRAMRSRAARVRTAMSTPVSRVSP